MHLTRARTLLIALTIAATTAPAASVPGPPEAQERSVEPVVLTGALFPTWSAGPDPTFREPQIADDSAGLQSDCREPGTNPYDPSDNGDHNCYQSSRLPRTPLEGAPVERILGYRWNAEAGVFEQIPFQVDERFSTYITNNVSGFAFYSGVDHHKTYAFDREGFRYTSDASQEVEGGNACLARPAPGSPMKDGYAATPDPVRGLDDDDELVFMWDDAGPQAPGGTPLPDGIDSSYEVAVVDPLDPSNVSYVYVMLADEDGPAPAFDASNGYVRYERDPDADLFLYSQSSYSNYGNAPKGPYCRRDGTPDTSRGEIAQRRPIDTAWVKTPRYWFRYEGRWLMTELRVSPDDTGLAAEPNVGPDLIDQWKARAFQQRPGGQTPCCGYEEEVNNWGGSSILLGERWGPVRVIRATWGADSSTNNVRMEAFYRDEIRFADYLRVHPIPPLDGIYVQWDYNAGKVTRYSNPWVPDGVPIDGQNDEVFGNLYVHAAKDKVEVSSDDETPVTGPIDVTVPLGGPYDNCRFPELPDNPRSMCNDIDVHDPTFSGPVGTLNWEQVSGPYGSMVTRWTVREHTPGGTPQAVLAMPYYRDDSCFDDGTGTDPGPHLRGRAVDEGPARPQNDETFNGDASEYFDPIAEEWKPRECWTPEHGDPALDPAGPRRFWQGSIGTHGLHLHIIAESDNAAMPLPLTEIVAEQRMVVLPGDPGNVGERYGRTSEFPLVALVRAVP